MPKLHIEERIAEAPEQAFVAFTEFSRTAERIPNVLAFEALNEGPVRKGSRFRETRVMFGKEHSEEFEIAEWSPPHRFTFSCNSCGAVWHFVHQFTPSSEGTVVSIDGEVQSSYWFAALMAPLAMLMIGSMRKVMQADLASVARSIERELAESSAT